MTEFVLINSPMQRYKKDERPNYQTTAPLGLGYVGTVTLNSGIDTKIIDAETNKLTVEEVVEKANSMNPNIVGINMTSTNSDISLEIVNKVKAGLRVLGGPHATLKGEYNRKYLIIKGEAENVLVQALRRGKTGIVNGGVVRDLDNLPFLNRDLFENEPYVNNNGEFEVSMATTRGCINNCIFCSVPILSGRRVRARSLGNVVQEILELKEKGVESLHFIDDTFNFNRARTEAFCDYAKELDISWRALCRIEGVDASLLEKMKESGCYKLGFGIESVSQKVLSYIGKHKDIEAIKKTFDLCKQIGIQTKGFFTIGYPQETEEDILKTISFIEDLNPSDICVTVVRAYPGTRLYKDMIKAGMPEEVLNRYHQFNGKGKHVKYHVMNTYSLNGMPMEQLDGLVNQAYERFNARTQ